MERRARLAQRLGITTVLDVGASAGQFGANMYTAGYTGRLVPFPPIPEIFSQLRKRAEGFNTSWETHNMALGDQPGRVQFNVSRDTVLPSLLAPSEELISTVPIAEVARRIHVEQRRSTVSIMTENYT